MIDNSIHPITHGVIAEYKEQVIKEYQGNPLIESLPEMMDKAQLIRSLSNYPTITNEELSMSGSLRAHIIERVYKFFQPLPIHIELEDRISRMIRQGYVYRNPFAKQIVEKYYEIYEAIEDKDITKISENHSMIPSVNSLSIIGVSGMGKSVSISKILNNYPQLIIHSKYKNINYSQYQLVYLFINTPHDGSIKGLCLDIISKFDQYLGTDYFRKVSNAPVNRLLPIICQIAKRASLGLLVIDEIQLISKAKSGGKDSILDFFLTLVNTIRVPVVLIGTNQAMSMLQSHFRQARRFTGKGEIIFDRITIYENNEWALFTKALLRFNATRKGVENQYEVSKALYGESQGIFDIAVKLYAMSQLEAINNGTEQVTPELIVEVAKSNLITVRPAIDAIRNNDLGALLEFEDIMPLNYNQKDISMGNYANKTTPKDKTYDNKNKVSLKPSKTKDKIDINELDEDDLRVKISKGINNDQSAYNILLRSGIVKQL